MSQGSPSGVSGKNNLKSVVAIKKQSSKSNLLLCFLISGYEVYFTNL